MIKNNPRPSLRQMLIGKLGDLSINHKIQIAFIALVCITLGLKLLPSNTMFLFHDQTQYARVIGFADALTKMQIPPLYAAEFNFGIGYPIYLFYAPLAYWVSGILYLLGIGIINAVRLSFLLALCIAASGMYSWLNRQYGRVGSWMGALLYVASPWFASEIFVRGNLATAWFLALAPWSLWAITRTHERKLLKVLVMVLAFIAHNALSLMWMPVLLLYAFFAHRKYRISRIILIGIAITVSGVFWIPALLQLNQTYAAQIAQLTKYSDHFLCVQQIWTTPFWGYGGSARGCDADGMSFMLGKLQIILAVLGLILGTILLKKRLPLFVNALIVLWMIFLTLNDAKPFWELAKPLQVIQFPWRLLSIALVFMSALVAATFHLFWEHIKIVGERDRLGLNKPYKKAIHMLINRLLSTNIQKSKGTEFVRIHAPSFSYFLGGLVCITFSIGIILTSLKFFQGREIPNADMISQFASTRYIRLQAAYDAPEYVPKTVDYTYWSTFRTKEPRQKDLDLLKKQFDAFRPKPLHQLVGAVLAVLSIAIILL